MIQDPEFPFKDDDVVKIEISNPVMIISHPVWWEMLDWSQMRDGYDLLPQDIKEKIQLY